MAFNRSNSRGCPCKDCEKRTLTCHSVCGAFAIWKQAEAERKEAIEQERRRYDTMSYDKKRQLWRKQRYGRQLRERRMNND